MQEVVPLLLQARDEYHCYCKPDAWARGEYHNS